ncbi:hypothetical protein BDV06DRAFT_93600 [Aspergillus oleicola]
MSYYGESSGYYGGERPPYERPPYERPPYEGSRSYDSRPPYSPAPPSARPPQYPPPPLPIGWIQEWEPSARRAFYIETSTGRTEWTLPEALTYGEGSRGGGDYYAARPVPAPYHESRGPEGYPPPGPEYGGGYGGGGEYPSEHKEKKDSDTGKLLAAGAAGLAIGGIGGAILGHELSEFSHTPFSCTLTVWSLDPGLY